MAHKAPYPHDSSMPMPMPPTYDQMQNQPGMYPPAQPPQQHFHYVPTHPTVIVEHQPRPTTVIMQPQVGPDPVMITCPSCHSTIVTRMEYEPTTRTHVCAALLCIFGCWLCVCLPYCMDSCRNGNHYCPSCGAFIGSYRS